MDSVCTKFCVAEGGGEGGLRHVVPKYWVVAGGYNVVLLHKTMLTF